MWSKIIKSLITDQPSTAAFNLYRSSLARRSAMCPQWSRSLDMAQQSLSRRSLSSAAHSSLKTSSKSSGSVQDQFFSTPQLLEQITSSSELDEHDLRRSAGKVESTADILKVLNLQDLKFMTHNIKSLVESRHPLLHTVAQYYFNAEGKKLRPLLVLLVSKMHSHSSSTDDSPVPLEILETQKVLAYITEIIHTATLLHDDVIDAADSRRSMPSANYEFGNKMAILAGDYLLARASVALSKLGCLRVVELMAEVIGELVEGEVMQINSTLSEKNSNSLNINWDEEWQAYLCKTYMKTASLMAKSCQSTVLLRNESDTFLGEQAYEFGKNFGIAFQLIDDYLDIASTKEDVGKPSSGSDIRLGLRTAPVLFACQQDPVLNRTLRSLDSIDDLTERDRVISDAVLSIQNTDALERTKELAGQYVDTALAALQHFPDCSGRDALNHLCSTVLTRTK